MRLSLRGQPHYDFYGFFIAGSGWRSVHFSVQFRQQRTNKQAATSFLNKLKHNGKGGILHG
ncbi:hypothetical protein BBD42_17455 [Paenibacillus sp. BIHB 4019]|uniref:Uncharacterized protein n=1 Tax=Paenibacillus sp. BIHB 4019 TaxID=1870819 RepID=A0A1B2DK50_9BACL|nr:hypothetical protein BBD42_17455 [Paenibacillus sp. BIHB 4019]